MSDADLILGRLLADEFLGGEMRLDVARARASLGPIARRLGRSLERAAAGVVAVATASMERAVRVITVERGLDPRHFTLFAFGGAGALHAADLADALGITRIYVPRDPGLLSAWGVLGAEAVCDLAETVRLIDPSDAALVARVRPLEREARRALARDGVAGARLARTLDVRYAGQGYEVQVPFGPAWRRAFHRRHRRLYGHADPARTIEVVAVRVRASGGGVRPPHERMSGARGRERRIRSVWFGGRRTRATVVRREELGRGVVLRGPAIVCEYSATTVVPPGWRLRVDRMGGLVLERSRRG